MILNNNESSFIEKILKLYENNPKSKIFAPLAETYRKAGFIDTAIEICIDGLKCHPDFHSGRVALGRCYLQAGKLEEAKSELRTVVQSVPDNILAQRLLAECYVKLNLTESAIKTYHMILYLNPDDVLAKSALAHLEKTLHLRGAYATHESNETQVVVRPPIEKYEPISSQDFLPEVKDALDYKDEEMVGSLDVFAVKPLHKIFENSNYEMDRSNEGVSSSDQEDASIYTDTMAEIYVNQGYIKKALEIYHAILKKDPTNSLILKKIETLKAKERMIPTSSLPKKNKDSDITERVRVYKELLGKIKATQVTNNL